MDTIGCRAAGTQAITRTFIPLIVVITCGHRPNDERIYQREIHSLLEAGYKVAYFTRWDGSMNLTNGNLNHINYKNTSILSFSNQIKSIAKTISPAVIHLHEFELLPLGRWFKKQFRVPVIYDVHDTLRAMWDTFSSKKGIVKRVVNWGLSRFEDKYLKYVDEILLANPVLGENYYADKGMSTTVIENYPYCELPIHFHPRTAPPIVLYQGQLSEDRGILVLLKAFQKAIEKHPDVQLIVTGPARYREFRLKMERFITDNKLSESVTIFPEVSSAKVWDYMHRATIGVIPSLNTSRTWLDTPTKLFEYMAAGCAVVASDLPPIRYHSNEVFVLVKPGNANELATGILSLLEDLTKLEYRINLSKKLIETRYNWDQVKLRFLGVYQKLLP